MADNEWKGASFKQDEDHSAETEKLLDRVNATTIPVLLRSSNAKISDIVAELLVLEKVARLGGDAASTKRLAVEVIRIYRTQNDLDQMLETLDFLMKKRGQTKQAQSAMIAECAIVLTDGSLSKEKQEGVLERLAYVTENKIHVELEHARFTIELATLHEAAGRKRSACDMLRVLHIETITSMPRLEKLEALNQQIRLCLELEDYDHIPMVSRKINHRGLSRDEAYEQKLKYFELMRTYYAHKASYFNVGRCWYEMYNTVKSANDKLSALSNMVVHYLISENATAKEIEDLAECTAFAPSTKMHDRVAALSAISEKLKSDLEDIPQLFGLLQRFNSIELIHERVSSEVEALCQTHPELAPFPERQKLLSNRCSEHDIMVIARFYSRIPLRRLAELVHLSPEHTELFIMTMVTNKTLYAKMDRVDGLVVFEARKNTTEVVALWNESVEKSVALLDKASHLITKERMLCNLASQKAH
ncbi:proteasome regulatory non-ATP-ase subunit 5 putative 19S proteasome regulatory subunit [Leptomonas seymouri]|uniref:Proteasome regulatory non-ATP-ase subunit 5 putative 19S proteasome regulatory subunit n=1 Tax=Leptomonas seymouri TaxID=5684 RepID=A0A0N1IAV3_LEPSE|nr:proteasome regulatory non-ATP-ase subunit 5 putative 19S proteasome regulatory subunit [Leptomonas seymouri]|eukprot:KPI89585.1 proteasome regulatory non-ATP-ase subunit 5 putative 19S proteasome regulatory subunit [Leptomonas seymouri]